MATCTRCGAEVAPDEQLDHRCFRCGTFLQDDWKQEPRVATAVVKNEEGPPPPEPRRPADPPEPTPEVTQVWQSTFAQLAKQAQDSDDTDQDRFDKSQATLNAHTAQAIDPSRLKVDLRTVGRSADGADYQVDFENAKLFFGDGPREEYKSERHFIGKGNMGVVWAARQASLDRTVAIKRPRPDAVNTPEKEGAFISEVVVTGKLEHPNIVPIYDLGRDAAGTLFYSMKHVQGDAWNEVLGEKTEQENLEILMKVCDAVHFAHSKGVIHRDIKPHNVMVGRFGEVALMDWGIAHSLGTHAETAWVGRGTGSAGTPAYMAPEMADPTTARLGIHSDVYLLGAILFEIIVGRPPHPLTRDTSQMLQNITRNVIVPTDRSGELVNIALRAMETDPRARYRDVEALQAALRDYWSHIESITLSDRGRQHLGWARSNGHSGKEPLKFTDFDRAIFAFEEAIGLWPENERAKEDLAEAKVEYARYNLAQRSYERGIELLDPHDPHHRSLLNQLRRARQKRDRQRQLVYVLSALLLVAVLGAGALTTLYKMFEADSQRIASDNARREAAKQQKLQRAAAANETSATVLEKFSQRAAEAEREAADRAEDARKEEIRSRFRAEQASYASDIGFAFASLERNSFDRALRKLREISGIGSRPRDAEAADNETIASGSSDDRHTLRHWEWGHLSEMVDLRKVQLREADTNRSLQPITSADTQGRWVVAGTINGEIRVWLDQQGDGNYEPWNGPDGQGFGWEDLYQRIDAVTLAVLEEESLVAVAGATNTGSVVHVWRIAANGDSKITLEKVPTDQGGISLDFSSNGSRLLVGTQGGDVQLFIAIDGGWESTDEVIKHGTDPGKPQVWSVAFSSQSDKIVTAGEDGKVCVWKLANDRIENPYFHEYDEHGGPVYAARFSPDGQQVISGGDDGRLLRWNVPDKKRISAAIVLEQRRSDIEAPEEGRLCGNHAGPIRSVDVQADIIVSAGDDNLVKVWSSAKSDGEPKKVLRGHGASVRSVAVADGGRKVMSAGYDGRLNIWPWEQVRRPLVLSPKPGLSTPGFNAATVSPSGRWLAAAATDGTAHVWDLQNERQAVPQQLRLGHQFLATRAILFDAGERLLTAAGDNQTILWNVRNGAAISQFSGTGARGVAAVSWDGEWVATGGNSKHPLQFWNVTQDQAPQSLLTDKDLGYVTALAFSRDSQSVLAGDDQGRCLLVDRRTGEILLRLDGHQGEAVTSAYFLPDKRQVLTAGGDGRVVAWDLSSGKRTQELEHPRDVLAMDVSRDGRFVLTATAWRDKDADVLRLWDLSLPDPIQRVSANELVLKHGADRGGIPFTIRSVAIDDATLQGLITVGVSEQVDQQKNQLAIWSLGGNYERLWPDRAFGDVAGAIFKPDGTLFIVGGKGARQRDLDGRLLNKFESQTNATGVSFSAASDWLALSSEDGIVTLWQLETKKWKLRDKVLGRCVAFHPSDNQLLITGRSDGQVAAWRRTGDTWKISHTVMRKEAPVHRLKFVAADSEPDILLVVTGDGVVISKAPWQGSDDEEAEVLIPNALSATMSPNREWLVIACKSALQFWNRKTTDDNRTLRKVHEDDKAHEDEITSVEFSHDGRRIVTASRDSTVKLWNSSVLVEDTIHAENTKPEELLAFREHAGPVTSATFSPDARALLSSGLDAQLIIRHASAVPPAWQFGSKQIECQVGGDPTLVCPDIQFLDPTRVDLSSAELIVQVQDGTSNDVLRARSMGNWTMSQPSNSVLIWACQSNASESAAAELNKILSRITYQREASGDPSPENEASKRNDRATIEFELHGFVNDAESPLKAQVTVVREAPLEPPRFEPATGQSLGNRDDTLYEIGSGPRNFAITLVAYDWHHMEGSRLFVSLEGGDNYDRLMGPAPDDQANQDPVKGWRLDGQADQSHRLVYVFDRQNAEELSASAELNKLLARIEYARAADTDPSLDGEVLPERNIRLVLDGVRGIVDGKPVREFGEIASPPIPIRLTIASTEDRQTEALTFGGWVSQKLGLAPAPETTD